VTFPITLGACNNCEQLRNRRLDKSPANPYPSATMSADYWSREKSHCDIEQSFSWISGDLIFCWSALTERLLYYVRLRGFPLEFRTSR